MVKTVGKILLTEYFLWVIYTKCPCGCEQLILAQKNQAENQLFFPLLVETELVSNPFQPNQTCVKGEHDFSQAMVSAAE